MRSISTAVNELNVKADNYYIERFLKTKNRNVNYRSKIIDHRAIYL